MSAERPASTSFPASMGPGARPVQPGAQRDLGDAFKDFAEQRSRYSIVRENGGIRVGYELKDVPRNHFLAFENIPLGGFSQTILFGGETRTQVSGRFVIDTIRGLENMTGRMLTQTQAEGVALHSSKRMLYSWSSTYLSVIGGAYLWRRGMKDMKFPFIKARSPDRYQKFPNRYLPVLQGQYARTMWQITRGFVWVTCGLFILSPFMNSIGSASLMTGLYRDDRTKDLMMSAKGSFNRVRSNSSQSASPGPTAPPQESYRSDGGPSTYSEADASNYGHGGTNDSFTGADADEFAGSTKPTIAPMRNQARTPERSTWGSGRSQPKQTPDPQQDRTSSSSPDFFFDDASPTAGNDPDTATSSTYKSSGSAWERVRRDVRGQPQQRQSQQAVDQSPTRARTQTRDQDPGDSFSFNGGDEEKVLAKQQAQKEFDAMLEKERSESGSEEYDRGMRAAGQRQESPGDRGGGERESVWARRRRG